MTLCTTSRLQWRNSGFSSPLASPQRPAAHATPHSPLHDASSIFVSPGAHTYMSPLRDSAMLKMYPTSPLPSMRTSNPADEMVL